MKPGLKPLISKRLFIFENISKECCNYDIFVRNDPFRTEQDFNTLQVTVVSVSNLKYVQMFSKCSLLSSSTVKIHEVFPCQHLFGCEICFYNNCNTLPIFCHWKIKWDTFVFVEDSYTVMLLRSFRRIRQVMSMRSCFEQFNLIYVFCNIT